jgi:glutathione S-transferase
MKPRLYIGNRNYSSWSLRPWLCLKWAGIDFDDTHIDLDQPGYGASGIGEILAISPAGKVPILTIGATVIWESPAIAEWTAESGRPGALLPADTLSRARIRAVAAEMHAGFAALRRDLPMNIRARAMAGALPADAQADIARIDGMWSSLRRDHGTQGDYLFGARSMADAFYLPVAIRFRSYGIRLSAPAQAYGDVLLGDCDFRAWEAGVLAEPAKPFSRARLDDLYPPAG